MHLNNSEIQNISGVRESLVFRQISALFKNSCKSHLPQKVTFFHLFLSKQSLKSLKLFNNDNNKCTALFVYLLA